MRVVIALGGNAILKRGELQTAENQRQNIKRAALAIGQVMEAGHEVIVTHGNGPQVGLMALQDVAYDQALASPFDVLGAETEGMIGYLIEQDGHRIKSVLTPRASGHPNRSVVTLSVMFWLYIGYKRSRLPR